jgi:ELWxxDGT repeat protein
VNGTLFFRGNDGIEGSELWKSDGTAAGTLLVKSFSPDGFSGEPDMFYNWAGTLYFTARDYGGFGLWKTDGTTAGTNLVRSIADGGPYLDLPRDLDAGTPWAAVMGDELYFLGDFHNRLWKTDGTAAGTVPVRQLVDTLQPTVPSNEIETWMIAASDCVYFVYSPYVGSGQSPRLMTSDGTSAGTLPISAADSGTDHAIISWSQQTVGGITYFAATDAAHGLELWRSDGTAAGTYLVRDVNPGALGSGVNQLVVMNGVLYFTAQNGATRGLWRSDGTEAGTWQVTSLASGVSWPTVVDGVLYFQSNVYNGGIELWRTDGTLEGTSLVKVVSPPFASPSTSRMIAYGGNLYFRTNDGVSGQELWKSDGTAEGTVLLADIAPGAAGSNPANFTVAGGFLYFATGQLTRDLWRTDGTAVGTVKLSSSSTFSVLGEFDSPASQEAGGLLYFVGNGADGTGNELWRSDGSVAGTFRLTNMPPGATNPSLGGFTNANGVFLFTTVDGSSQRQLWRSDGTVAGTTLVTPILAAAGTVVSVNGFRQVGDDSWFTVGNSSNEVEFWRTDGTAAGTIFVTAVGGVTLPPSAPPPIVVGNHLVAPLRTLEYGIELWSAQFIETPPLAGDLDRDGVVDGADFLFWQRNFGAAANPYGAGADGDQSGRVGSGDLDVWKENYGATTSVVAAAAAPASIVAPDVHRSPLPVAAPLAATIAATGLSPEEANYWSVVAQRPSSRAERGRLNWFLDLPPGIASAARVAAFHAAASKPADFPVGFAASLWKSVSPKAWDLLARESLVAGVSGPGGVASSLRPEKSSPFDGEEIDWRLEQLFQTERLAGTDSRDEL